MQQTDLTMVSSSVLVTANDGCRSDYPFKQFQASVVMQDLLFASRINLGLTALSNTNLVDAMLWN